MTNEITKWEDRLPLLPSDTEIINCMQDEIAELRAKVESLAADAERWKKFERALRTGHIPGAGHGRRFSIMETDPMYGDEKEFNDFIGAIDAMAKEKA